MASVNELKEMIIDLRMNLVRANIPSGNCPYAYYRTTTEREGDCEDCDKCSAQFFKDMEYDIRLEVEEL